MKNLGFRQIMILVVLSSIIGIAYLVPYLRFTFYDQMMAAWNLNDVQMGAITTAMGAMNFVCYIIGGFFANKFSMRNLILITLIVHIALTIWMAFTTSFVAVLIIHVLFAFCGIALLWSAYLTGLRTLGDESLQSKIFGTSETIRGCVQTIASFLFLGLMGIAAASNLGIRYVLLSGAAMFAILLVLSYIFLPKTDKLKEPVTAEEVSIDEKKYTYLDVMKSKGVWLTILICFCTYMTWTLANNYLSTYSVRVLGISDSLASTIAIVRSYAIVLPAGLIGGFLLNKFSYKGKGFVVFFIVLTAILLGIICTNKIPALCLGLTLMLSFMMNVMKATYWSVMGEAGIPLKMTPLATGFISLVMFSPDLFMPSICSAWIDAAATAGNIVVGFNKIFIVMAICAAIGIIAGFVLMNYTKSLEKKGIIEVKNNSQAA